MFNATWSQCQFKRFFQAWNDTLINIMVNECNAVLEGYRIHPHRAYTLTGCLIDNTPSFRQSEMNAVSVILGLTPTIIRSLGPTTVQTSALSIRKPVLALMVALGTPATRPQTGTEFVTAVKQMATKPSLASVDRVQHRYSNDCSPRKGLLAAWSFLNMVTRSIWPVGVYVVVAGCMANNAYLAYQLSCWCVCSFTPPNSWLPALWTYLSLAVHIAAVVTMWRLVSVSKSPDSSSPATLLQWLLWKIETEAIGSKPLFVQLRDKAPGSDDWYQLLAWVLYVGASLHMVVGLVVLAGLLFISLQDAALVVARYVACTLICRVVVVVEIERIRRLGFQITNNDPVDWAYSSENIRYVY